MSKPVIDQMEYSEIYQHLLQGTHSFGFATIITIKAKFMDCTEYEQDLLCILLAKLIHKSMNKKPESMWMWQQHFGPWHIMLKIDKDDSFILYLDYIVKLNEEMPFFSEKINMTSGLRYKRGGVRVNLGLDNEPRVNLGINEEPEEETKKFVVCI